MLRNMRISMNAIKTAGLFNFLSLSDIQKICQNGFYSIRRKVTKKLIWNGIIFFNSYEIMCLHHLILIYYQN